MEDPVALDPGAFDGVGSTARTVCQFWQQPVGGLPYSSDDEPTRETVYSVKGAAVIGPSRRFPQSQVECGRNMSVLPEGKVRRPHRCPFTS
jgi:hypothetical protein